MKNGLLCRGAMSSKLRKRIEELEAQVIALQATVDAQRQLLARRDARIAALRSSQRTGPMPLNIQAAGMLACMQCTTYRCDGCHVVKWDTCL